MKVSVFGLGYVGTVTSACLAHQGHDVVGVDIEPSKVELINQGRSPMVEPDLDVILGEVVGSGRLTATTDTVAAISATTLSLVCVGTPERRNGNIDLQFVERVCREIGSALADKEDFHVVALRSTVLPGTSETFVIPLLQEVSGKTAGKEFGVCFIPEFLREGSSVHDFSNPPFTVIGGHDPRATQIGAQLFAAVSAPLMEVPLRLAEMLKYVCNAFHALKVAFANEVGNLCERQGIDSHELMEIFCMDDILNLSPYYLKPGFAFGGSCLPKDLKALLFHGHRMDLRLPVLESILPSNDLQIRRGIELVQDSGHRNIGVLGFSFKANTDDLRESPFVKLIENLIGKGYQVKVYDRNVSLARLHGTNRAFIEREIPHIASLMCESAEEVIDSSDVIVIGHRTPEFLHALNHARPGQVIVDLVRLADRIEIPGVEYQGIGW
ncbi:MAG: UDP-glucose/GDP-mannose dehydrogenase family protein [Anaerolineales bacterium]|jgi:GDP-mannose 6-dehydrogenase